MQPDRSVRVTILAGAIAFGGVVLIELFGSHYAYDNLHFFIALRTAEALIALMAAFLFYGRYRRRERLDDLVLSTGFAILALNNLCFGAIPAIGGDEPTRLAVWAGTFASLAGTGLLAAAALLRPRRLALRRGRMLAALTVPFLVAGVIAALVGAMQAGLPDAVEVTRSGSGEPGLDAHWFITASQVLLFVLFTAVALRFAARGERECDEFFAWLAIGAVLAAAARLAFVFYPSLHSILFSTGDALRLAFYVVVLAAALREISSYWSSVADVAALEERRRVARDVHDVLAQDIASIGRNLRWLDDDDRFVQRARAAADRALLETRRALAVLTERADQPLHELIHDVARKVGQREGVNVALSAEGDIEVDPAQAGALAMIATEAITNAARHGGVSVVQLELHGGRRVSLRIADEGRGFEVSDDGIGYGLRIMRERAEAIGAEFRVDSRPGGGSEILVML